MSNDQTLDDAVEQTKDKEYTDTSENNEEEKEKETTTRFTADLPDSLHHEFKVLATQQGESMKDFMIEALKDRIAKLK